MERRDFPSFGPRFRKRKDLITVVAVVVPGIVTVGAAGNILDVSVGAAQAVEKDGSGVRLVGIGETLLDLRCIVA